MALKGIFTPTPPKKSKPPVDYLKHMEAVPSSGGELATKPLVGYQSVDKSVKGVPVSGSSAGETQALHSGVFTKHPTMSITVEGGRTLNLGNYESAKLAVTVTVPCEPSTLEEAYDWATEWVSGKLEAAVKDAKGL